MYEHSNQELARILLCLGSGPEGTWLPGTGHFSPHITVTVRT